MARGRLAHAVIANAAMVTMSAFYLMSPTVYAYFSEVSMSYSRVPKWFAATPAAKLTARVFDSYNVNAPRAVRFSRQLSCFLVDAGSTRKPGCMHQLRERQMAYGPASMKIPSGRYVARFEFARLDECSAGEGRLQVVTTGRFGRILADYAGPIAPGDQIALPFHLRQMDAALAPVEFRIFGVSGCVLLSRAGWTDAPADTVIAARDRGAF